MPSRKKKKKRQEKKKRKRKETGNRLEYNQQHKFTNVWNFTAKCSQR
jgi:hypothetical protein